MAAANHLLIWTYARSRMRVPQLERSRDRAPFAANATRKDANMHTRQAKATSGDQGNKHQGLSWHRTSGAVRCAAAVSSILPGQGSTGSCVPDGLWYCSVGMIGPRYLHVALLSKYVAVTGTLASPLDR